MKNIPKIGSRVIVARIPKGWGMQAQGWVNTAGMVRAVYTIHTNAIVAIEFPDWNNGHTLNGLIKRTAGWYFLLQWIEPSGG